MTGYPMPGPTDFTAAEEQQMRQSQNTINSLAATNTANGPPQQSQSPAGGANKEAGLAPVAAGLGNAVGGMLGGMGGGGE